MKLQREEGDFCVCAGVSSRCVVLCPPSLTSDTEAFIFTAVALWYRSGEGIRPGQSIEWRMDEGIVNGRASLHKGQVVVLGRNNGVVLWSSEEDVTGH
jgi:hypothetical protein